MTISLPVPNKPLNVLITKTLTLPDVTADEASMIQEAAGPDSVVNIVDSPKAGMVYALSLIHI